MTNKIKAFQLERIYFKLDGLIEELSVVIVKGDNQIQTRHKEIIENLNKSKEAIWSQINELTCE